VGGEKAGLAWVRLQVDWAAVEFTIKISLSRSAFRFGWWDGMAGSSRGEGTGCLFTAATC
jgi:hypothetical protein